MFKFTRFVSFLLLFTNPIFSTIINVPGDQSSIQEGIDAAVIGDTVLVGDSTYYENINFKGKAITVASHYIIDGDTNHINNTVINGSQPTNPDSGSVVYFISDEDTTSILCGFTIRGGIGTIVWWWGWSYKKIGGGIFCVDSNPKILNSIITENNDGGAIKGQYSRPFLSNLRFINNRSSYAGLAGGLNLVDCVPKLENVDICYNITDHGYGGGIFCDQSSPYFSNVNIHHNIAREEGGGIYFNDSTPIFDLENRCNIYLNLTGHRGHDVAADLTYYLNISVDTFTVLQPMEMHAYPLTQFRFDIQNEKIVQVAADLYIDPVTGNDNNSGLTQGEPLKTITMGLHKAVATENDPRTLYLANGLYTPQTEFYFPLFFGSYFSLKGKTRDGTIIDAQGFNSIFELCFGRNNVSFSNITVTGCSGNDRDTAIRCYESELSMKNVTITDNQGIGLWIRNGSSGYLDSCLIRASGYQALDIWLSSEAIIKNTIIEQNNGCGIYIHDNSNINIENVIIQDNYSSGLACSNSNINANNLSVLRNQKLDYFCDGTVNISSSYANITNSIIAGNQIDGRGGGIYIGGTYIGSSTVNLISVNIAENEASYKGGGIYIDDYSTVQLSDVSVNHNKADHRGGGIYFYPSANVNFDPVNRCNVYSNKGPYGSDLCAEFYSGTINVIVDTFTVLNPDSSHAYPLDKFTFDILHDTSGTQNTIEEKNTIPLEFTLYQNYPNPFNPTTNIEFSIPNSDFVTLKIYNILGEEMTTLVSEILTAGKYKYEWDASGLASGIYLYQIKGGDFTQVRKMVLIK